MPRESLPHWTWARASCRGTSHFKQGTRRQDAVSCLGTDPQTLIAVVCDGAGSSSYGGEGASLAARTVMRRAADHLRATGELPIDEMIWSWVDDIRDQLARASTARNIELRSFAATLVGVITRGSETVVFHIGDGAAVGRNAVSGTWDALSWPEHGEYASTTFFVTDDPSVRLRIARPLALLDAVAVFTDGIERLALSFVETKPHNPFFNGMIKPVQESEVAGCDQALSAKLAAYLDSSAVNARTDDDKSLVIAALR
jgi:Protein phosphatase 2C